MKKILLSLLAIAATANAFALNIVAQADITIKDATAAYEHTLTIAEITDLNVSDYCAEIYEGAFGSVNVAFYAIANSTRYEIFASNNIDGQALGVKTYTGTEYTLTFSNLEGATLYLVDAVADKFIEITAGGSYAFTAEANQTIADRFSISKYPPYLFIGHKLILGDKKPGSVAKAKSFEYQDGKRVFTGHDVSGDGATLLLFQPSYYEVTYTNRKDEEKKFIVNANPNVVPANP